MGDLVATRGATAVARSRFLAGLSIGNIIEDSREVVTGGWRRIAGAVKGWGLKQEIHLLPGE